jgi:poly-beta-1,6-N-acetyl-D-glucosamine synthase
MKRYLKLKLIISLAFSFLWFGVSYWIAIPWISEVSSHFGDFLAYFFIIGVALLPAIAISFVYMSIMLDKRVVVKKISKPITILIAAYNEEDTILHTLESIETQEFDDEIEVIVCNDGSIDLTSNIVENFINRKNLRFDYRLINLDKNRGKSFALNEGLKQSKFERIVTIDADSVLYKNALLSIVSTLESGDFVSVAGTVLVKNSKVNLLTRIQNWDYLLGISSVKRAQSAYEGTLVAQGAFSIYYKKQLLETGGWSDKVGEDIVLTWELLNKGYKIYHDTNAIVFTSVPITYKSYFKQRKRWSRGMIEAFKTSPSLLFKFRKTFTIHLV